MEKTMEKIVALAKARGFVYPGSEIYGGLANTWDYGNLGVELKNNVKKAWWQKFVQESPYNVGVDCAILMNPQTWVASGHLGGFSDPLMDCKECHERFRADKLIEDWADENNYDLGGSVDGWTQEQMKNFIDEFGQWLRHKIRVIILKQWKVPPRIYKNLQKLNEKLPYHFSDEQLYSVANTRLGLYKQANGNVINFLLNADILAIRKEERPGLVNPLAYYLR